VFKVCALRLAQNLVTNAEYLEFERALFGRAEKANPTLPDHPVKHVSHPEAVGYCQWLSAKTGEPYRLPTEAEWEFAASSRGRTLFPWGNEFEPYRANTLESGIGRTTPVGSYPAGASAEGVLDLAGNVEEWSSSIYLPYPGGRYIEDHITRDTGFCYPVARGGSYVANADLCMAPRRHGYRPNHTVVGFRIARSIVR